MAKKDGVVNFGIEVEIDGRPNKLRGKTKTITGGFKLKVDQRTNGATKETATIEGKTSTCGQMLGLTVVIGDKTYTYWTPR